MKTPATCKFCGCKLILDTDDDCPIGNIETWVAMAACNRCADYHEFLWRICDAIRKLCSEWNMVMLFEKKAERKAEVRKAVEVKLTGLTKRLADKVCDYNRVQRTWEQDFVDMLIDKPNKADTVVKLYVSGIAKIKASAPPVEMPLPYRD